MVVDTARPSNPRGIHWYLRIYKKEKEYRCSD